MDVNEHPTEGKFSKRLSATNPDIYEISHKCWGPEAPYTHINCSQPIDRGCTGFGESKTFFGGPTFTPHMMGLGQEGNRAAPPSWIQLSSIMVSVFKQLERGAFIMDPITLKMIHMMGAFCIDDTDLYTWQDGIVDITNSGNIPSGTWRHGALSSMQWVVHSNQRNVLVHTGLHVH